MIARLLKLLGFVEELPLDYQPQREPRDLRPPYCTSVAGRRRVIDRAIMEPLDWVEPKETAQ